MSDLAIVVVTHDSAHELEACVNSVLSHRGGADTSITVCDSGSSDDVEQVADRLPVRFLPGPNRGFSAACNRGLAASADSRYVLFLNPDARIVDGSLSRLLDECDRRPSAGIVAVRLVDQHGDLLHNMGLPATPAQFWKMARTGWGQWDWETTHYEAERACAWDVAVYIRSSRP